MSDDTIKAGMYGVGAAIMALWQSVGTALAVYLALAILDAITAAVANGKLRQLNPEAGTYGWRRKINLILLILAVAFLQQGIDPGVLAQFFPQLQSLPLAQTVAGIFSVYEVLSIARNYLYSGGYIPKFLAEALGVKELPPRDPPEGVIGFLGTPKWHTKGVTDNGGTGTVSEQPGSERGTLQGLRAEREDGMREDC